MANTYTFIASSILGSATSGITFSGIPSTYNDLIIKFSTRSSNNGAVFENILLTFNGSGGTAYSKTLLYSQGSVSTNGSNRESSVSRATLESVGSGQSTTASTFGSGEIYIPSYATSQYKSFEVYGLGENNSSAAYMGVTAALWRSTAAITSITLAGDTANFATGSSFYLYGIKNS